MDLVGKNRRNVDISYVIPTPVWKVSYRLDLNQSKPFLQGWAIIDNDGDTDWVDVELSLVTGRPVSFIQNLYPPYYVNRPTLPLSIAGIAQARTHESAYGIFANDSEADRAYPMADGVYESAPAAATAMRTKSSNNLAYAPAPAPLTGGVINTAAGASAGDQFEFTLKKPVTLARQQSAMLPLVEGAVTAVKALVFSGAKAVYGNAIHPEISAELTNNTGMKLPAGPITVFDGGAYAGDALLEFLPENEKRLISYGEDLSVSGNTTNEVNRPVTSVKISKGTMTINRSVSNEKTYIIKNASSQSKSLIIEHTKTNGATLKEPAKSDEETSALYRFKRPLAANATITFTVKEESPVVQQITLGRLNIDSFASYSTSGEMPENVRAAFSKAIALKNTADDQQKTLADLTARRERLLDDETRIRANIEAAGNTSEQGILYLTRLAAIDTEIDAQTEQIDTQRAAAEKAKTDYDNYISSLEL
ncbi:hypothetical protein FACS189494_09000 [Spirochaetia bacterium]|nr:hypothetical protein FACS189494_09000 [Spirochaetia bacterium]